MASWCVDTGHFAARIKGVGVCGLATFESFELTFCSFECWADVQVLGRC
jgi:hypothetical protein